MPDDNKERLCCIWSTSIGFDAQFGFTEGINILSSLFTLAFPFCVHLSYGVSIKI